MVLTLNLSFVFAEGNDLRTVDFGLYTSPMLGLHLDHPLRDEAGGVQAYFTAGVAMRDTSDYAVHLGFRRFFHPLRKGAPQGYWAVGLSLEHPFRRFYAGERWIDRFNFSYLGVGYEGFVYGNLYMGARLQLHPVILYNYILVPSNMPPNRGTMDLTGLFVVAPTLYVGYFF
ncbi:MAG TPA: hypothetical protein ENK37_01200 [Oceanithermus profundus]|uniref:Uncharacterized protein n=1 Tax=Oceanithermus profundus TaxID=187137 RepID=A0A7C4ZGG7_9DEIN|nr:hypothetical protein [Oceanithermus profundus]